MFRKLVSDAERPQRFYIRSERSQLPLYSSSGGSSRRRLVWHPNRSSVQPLGTVENYPDLSIRSKRDAMFRLRHVQKRFLSVPVKITRTKAPKPRIPKQQLLFGKTFTDHMLVMDWVKGSQWTPPEIIPYSSFCIDPASTVFHYALSCFEGMKAYLDDHSQIRLFRPDMNMRRLKHSASRLVLECPDENLMLDSIKELIKVDRDWIPKGFGYSLYIRPTLISTYPFLGVAPSEQSKFFTIMCPVGPYYATGFKAVSLLADDKYVRAWRGGAGCYKIGANYAPTIKAQKEAAAKGFAQVLWLFGDDHQVTEVGTMNQFFFWRTSSGEKELVTAPLEDGTILPGVTRDSILALCREWGEFKVTERRFTLHEVIDAIQSGRMLEAFGSGTAAIVSPVKNIHFKGEDYPIPLDPTDPIQQAGLLAQRISKTILEIQVRFTLSFVRSLDLKAKSVVRKDRTSLVCNYEMSPSHWTIVYTSQHESKVVN